MLRFNLRKKLLFFSIALAIIPLVIAGQTMIRITQDELKSSANDELSNTARQLAGEINDWYENTWLAPLLLIRNAIENETLGIEEKVSLLTLGIQDITDIVALQITVAEAPIPMVTARESFTRRLREASLDPREILRLPLERVGAFQQEGETFIEDLTYIPQTDDWLSTIVLPLRSQFSGSAFLSARIDLRRLRRFIENHPFNKTGMITLVDEKGIKIFDAARPDLSDFRIVADAIAFAGSGFRMTRVGPFVRPDGEIMLGAYSFPHPFSWAIILEKNQKDAYLAVKKMANSLFLWVFLGLAIAVGGAVVFALRISRPILEIDRVAAEVTKGNLRARVQGVKSKDEIGNLAEQMNAMICGLIERFHLEKFVSGETMSAIRYADPDGIKLGGTRKLVTVFFSDIRGFTAFSEKVEPDIVIEMLNTYLRHQAYIVKKYHGDIDKFVGDELVGVFQGADMVKNAVLCAQEIQEKIVSLNTEHPEWDLAVGIGINTGEVVMGAMGSEDRMDYTILGDSVNLGARLCSHARAGQILLSESAYRYIATVGSIVAIKLNPVKVKGKSEPIQIYEVRGSSSNMSRVAG